MAVLRIAVPYTGLIVSTRESQRTREMVLDLGVSQLSGASSTSVGGYAERSARRTTPRSLTSAITARSTR